MFKRNLAVIITSVLLSAAGAVQAANPTFPSAAEEGPESSVNAMLPAIVSGLTGADSVFPSAGKEGSEDDMQNARFGSPRNLERSYAGGHGNVFPSAAIE
ncbi:MAG: hypothetical protein K2Y31_01970 [Burkholderiales bacterium]|jgi:hypothetical protein|nr:hypothetical protein [Burkholderiales bacterium]